MELVVLTLTAPANRRFADPGPQLITDILWANASASDLIEHISVHPGPLPGSYSAALFLRLGRATRPAVAGPATALRLGRAAVTTSPPLAGWTAGCDSAELPLGD